MPPDILIGLRVADLGPVLTPFLRERFSDFDFTGITLRHPDETFDKERTLDIGGREVRLLNLGPAHTDADTVVHLPDTGSSTQAICCSSAAPRSCGADRSPTGSPPATP